MVYLSSLIALRRAQPLAGVAMALAIFLGVPPAGHAQTETIISTYQWVSSTAQDDGSYATRLTFSFTNNGVADFNDLRVRLMDSPPFSLFFPASELAVGPLLVGATTTGSWDILFPYPIEATPSLVFLGEGSEADGTGELLPMVIMEEGAVQ